MAATARLDVPCTRAVPSGNEAPERSEVFRASLSTLRSCSTRGALRSRLMSQPKKVVVRDSIPAGVQSDRRLWRGAARAESSGDKSVDAMRDVTEEVKAELKASGAQGGGLQGTFDAVAKVAPEPIKGLAKDAASAHSPEAKARGAKLHDFCLGIPYGALLALGGLGWFVFAGSRGALIFGCLLGSTILASSWLSFQTWKKGKSSTAFTAASTVLSFVVFGREATRFARSGALFPTGVTAVVSFTMAAFFLYVILAGGNKPKKSAKAVA